MFFLIINRCHTCVLHNFIDLKRQSPGKAASYMELALMAWKKHK